MPRDPLLALLALVSPIESSNVSASMTIAVLDDKCANVNDDESFVIELKLLFVVVLVDVAIKVGISW